MVINNVICFATFAVNFAMLLAGFIVGLVKFVNGFKKGALLRKQKKANLIEKAKIDKEIKEQRTKMLNELLDKMISEVKK